MEADFSFLSRESKSHVHFRHSDFEKKFVSKKVGEWYFLREHEWLRNK